MLIQVLLTIPIIIVFIFIYRKYKTDNEEFLVPKLVGYYLLGSLKFSFNEIALPAGFIAFFVFFKPQINKSLKKAAVFLGLFAFICGLLFPVVQKSYFERQRAINISSTNIYTIDLYKDHNAIKEKLGVNQGTKIEDFEVIFDNSGVIKELKYLFLTKNNEGIILYNVQYSTDKNKYIIRARKVNQWVQYDRLIDEGQFFYAFNHLNLEKARPKKVYPYYTAKCNGDYTNWGVKNSDNFLITDNGFKKIKNEELPVSGYAFWVFGNKEISENSYSSDSSMAYILSVQR